MGAAFVMGWAAFAAPLTATWVGSAAAGGLLVAVVMALAPVWFQPHRRGSFRADARRAGLRPRARHRDGRPGVRARPRRTPTLARDRRRARRQPTTAASVRPRRDHLRDGGRDSARGGGRPSRPPIWPPPSR